jgi:hypothetical protein
MKQLFTFVLMVFVSSCSTIRNNNENIYLTDIKIETQGNSLEDSDEMREVCSEFKLTVEQVRTYYFESHLSSEQEVHDEYNILPCNSTGTMIINGELFSWIIRAGGVGNFESEDKSFVRVCDEKCCKNTKGIC